MLFSNEKIVHVKIYVKIHVKIYVKPTEGIFVTCLAFGFVKGNIFGKCTR